MLAPPAGMRIVALPMPEDTRLAGIFRHFVRQTGWALIDGAGSVRDWRRMQ